MFGLGEGSCCNADTVNESKETSFQASHQRLSFLCLVQRLCVPALKPGCKSLRSVNNLILWT